MLAKTPKPMWENMKTINHLQFFHPLFTSGLTFGPHVMGCRSLRKDPWQHWFRATAWNALRQENLSLAGLWWWKLWMIYGSRVGRVLPIGNAWCSSCLNRLAQQNPNIPRHVIFILIVGLWMFSMLRFLRTWKGYIYVHAKRLQHDST